MVEKKYFTLKEAAKYTGYAKSTLYNYVYQNRIPYYKPSKKKLLFKQESLDKWVESSLVSKKS